MKTWVKVILIVAAALAALGLMLGGIGLIVGSIHADRLLGQDGGEAAGQVSEENRYEIPDSFRKISLDWVSGEVTVEPWDGDTIVLEESSYRSISARNRLHYEIDGDELEVSYFRGEHHFRLGGNKSKDLKVLIPESMLKDLEKLDVEGVSAHFEIRDLDLRKLEAETVSGNVNLKNMEAEKVEAETVSGNLQAEFSRCPDRIELETVSGSMELELPEDSRIHVSREGVSGKLDSEFTSQEGASCRIRMESVSGSLTIRKHP